MKNLIVYIHPNKTFNLEEEKAARIQIDNSLELGWVKEDIWLITNFPYKYHDVRAIVLEDSIFCPFKPPVSKINAVLKLFEKGLIGDDLYWLHDLDAFQVSPFTVEEVNLGNCDMGVCNYGRVPMWAAGTILFNKNALDILRAIQQHCYHYRVNEQKALRSVAGCSYGDDELRFPMGKRVKLMNISYNFNTCNMRSNWIQAEKPIKVVHFHLTPEMIAIFLGEKNSIGPDLVTNRFRQVFIRHGLISSQG